MINFMTTVLAIWCGDNVVVRPFTRFMQQKTPSKGHSDVELMTEFRCW